MEKNGNAQDIPKASLLNSELLQTSVYNKNRKLMKLSAIIY